MEFFGFTFIMFVGAAIALGGLLLLIAAAFATSAGWGIASLVFPPAAIGFAISHFSKGRNGFALLMIGVIIFGYGSWDKRRIEHAEEVQAVKEQEQRLVEPVIQPQPVAPVAPGQPSSAAVPPPSAPTTPANAPKATGEAAVKSQVINIIDAQKYVGKLVRVTTVNGAVRTGELLSVGKEGIVMNFKPKGVDTLVKADIKESEIHLIELVE